MSKDELTEGVTPIAKIYSGPPLVNKTDPFKGDPPPGVDRLEMKYVDPGPHVPPDERGVVLVPHEKIGVEEAKKRFRIKLAPRPKKGEDTIKIMRPIAFKDMPKTTTIEHMADEMLNDVVRKARPAKLDAHFATDSEIEEIERLVDKKAIKHWPLLRRLLNRLRRAEGK